MSASILRRVSIYRHHETLLKAPRPVSTAHHATVALVAMVALARLQQHHSHDWLYGSRCTVLALVDRPMVPIAFPGSVEDSSSKSTIPISFKNERTYAA